MYTSGDANGEFCVAPGHLAYGVAGGWAAAGTIFVLYHRAGQNAVVAKGPFQPT